MLVTSLGEDSFYDVKQPRVNCSTSLRICLTASIPPTGRILSRRSLIPQTFKARVRLSPVNLNCMLILASTDSRDWFGELGSMRPIFTGEDEDGGVIHDLFSRRLQSLPCCHDICSPSSSPSLSFPSFACLLSFTVVPESCSVALISCSEYHF